MTDSDPALIDLDSTRQAHERMYAALGQTEATSPEARVLRSALANVSKSLTRRDHRALDTDMASREIQFLSDLRDAADLLLETSIPAARKHSGLTWKTVGELLGITRQAAWERYDVQG